MDETKRMKEVIRMQKHLLLIRRTVGWTAKEFGEKIGVTRQTINNIEGGRYDLTKTQYIAMRSVLDAEMAQSPEDTEMLRTLLEILVDHPENYSKSEREQLLSKANMLSPAILSGASTRKEVSKEWISIASVIGESVLAIITAIKIGKKSAYSLSKSAWLTKIMSDIIEEEKDK